MDKVWICLMVSRTLLHDDVNAISQELKLLFGSDLFGYKVVWNEHMAESGEYYLFVHCGNYWDHAEAIEKSHYVTGIVPSKESPHHFNRNEISEFLASVGHKEVKDEGFDNGDVVLVKTGYLKGLYGIVIKSLTHKKCKVFFSLYVRQFSKSLCVTSLEYIGKVSGYKFPTGVVAKAVIIGAHVVHHSELCRKSDRKSKTGERRRKSSAVL